jgi:thymidylate synthase (FAD)
MKVVPMTVTLIDSMGSDLSVVNAARVSFNKESEWEYTDTNGLYLKDLSDKDTKLIKYLAKHKHFSPFNHTFITTRVKAPIFVARQLVKHKFLPWNEVSRRYVDDEPEFYIPDTFRGKPENSKQGSSGVVTTGSLWCFQNGLEDLQAHSEDSLRLYEHLLNEGVCPEQARMVLPQNMMTEWIWSGTLGAFADMLKLRLDPHTQQESREIAEQIRDLLEPLFPVSLPALLGE